MNRTKHTARRRPTAQRRRPEPEHVLRLTEPDDLLDAIPYLIGFHPSESVVVVGLSVAGEAAQRPRVRITARVDVADVLRAPKATLANIARAVDHAGADLACVAVYRAQLVEAAMLLPTLEPLARCLDEFGLESGNWLFHGADGWAMGVVDEGGEGVKNGLDSGGITLVGPFDHRVSSTVAAEATYAGLVARPDRQSLVQTLAARPVDERLRLLPTLNRALADRRDCSSRIAQTRRRADIRALFAATRTLPVLDQAALTRFGAALVDIEVRDACWLAIEAKRIDDESLWQQLSRELPDEFRAAPLFLLGWQLWRNGNGALAGIAADEALSCDPGYRAADLLIAALTQGLDPHRTPRLRRGA
jgi:hypothetical protein